MVLSVTGLLLIGSVTSLGGGGSTMTTTAFAGSLTLQTRPVALRSLGGVSVAPDTGRRPGRPLRTRAARTGRPLAGRSRPRTAPARSQRAPGHPTRHRPGWLRGPDGLRFLIGNLVPDGALPVAQAYSGHQFGGYVPRLGDGRALLLGELTTADGGLRDLHLKGSGATPFARGGDGLAAVGPMLREYIISEAMHALGIPTTRSLAVVATGRSVHRETPLPGAVLARIASSHLRVGTFQYVAAGGDADLLRRLADHAIARHYPDAAHADNPYLALFDAVGSAQAALIAQWMLVGFVHGVMNTDNMTISGETIDYGPCAFMDAYDPETVFSSIDSWGRYAYANQPSIAGWNLARFAETLLPLIDDDQDRAVALAQESLAGFGAQIQSALASGMRAKLGLVRRYCRGRGHTVDQRRARTACGQSRRLHIVLPSPRPSSPRRHRACARDVHRPRGVRRLARAVAGPEPGCAGHGPGQPRLHSAKPSRRGGAASGDGRRPEAAGPAPGSHRRTV